jgi:hypothetical protein
MNILKWIVSTVRTTGSGERKEEKASPVPHSEMGANTP